MKSGNIGNGIIKIILLICVVYAVFYLGNQLTNYNQSNSNIAQNTEPQNEGTNKNINIFQQNTYNYDFIPNTDRPKTIISTPFGSIVNENTTKVIKSNRSEFNKARKSRDIHQAETNDSHAYPFYYWYDDNNELNWYSKAEKVYWQDMTGGFVQCSYLTSVDLSGMDVSLVNSFLDLFYGCTSLEYINLSGWHFNETVNNNEIMNNFSMFTGTNNIKHVVINDSDNNTLETICNEIIHSGSNINNITFETTNTVNSNELADLIKKTCSQQFGKCIITVIDNYGNTVKNAEVTFRGNTKRTDNAGNVTFENIPPTEQSITASYNNHTTTTSVAIQAGRTAEITMSLDY